MRHRTRIILALIVLLLAPTTQARAESIQWVTSLNKALSKAKSQPKLIMIDFYTDWCTWCKKLDTVTYVDGRVVKLASQIYSVKLNAEDGAEGTKWAKKLDVHGYPAIIFLAPSGELFGSIRGYQSPDTFTVSLQKMLDLHQEIPKLKMRVKQKDGVAAARLAMFYASQSKTTEVLPLLQLADARVPKDENLLVAYNTLGATYGMSKEYKRAIVCFDKVLQRSNNAMHKTLARFRLGLCYYSLKQPKLAQPHLQAVAGDVDAPPKMREQAQRILQQVNMAP